MAKKDRTKCRDCQDRPIEYTHGLSGSPMLHGVCRDCYEQMIRRSRTGKYHAGNGRGRTADHKEATHETKYGRD